MKVRQVCVCAEGYLPVLHDNSNEMQAKYILGQNANDDTCYRDMSKVNTAINLNNFATKDEIMNSPFIHIDYDIDVRNYMTDCVVQLKNQ